MAAFMLFSGSRRSRHHDGVVSEQASDTTVGEPASAPALLSPGAAAAPRSVALGGSRLRRSRRYRSDGILGLRWLA